MLAARVPVAAAGASPAARLVYARTAEASSCPGETALRSAVTARFGYDPFFAWAKRTVVVQLSRPRGRYVAHVQLLDEQGIAYGTRELSSDQSDCSDIIAATALAISIALDAAPNLGPPPAPPPVPPPPPPVAAPSAQPLGPQAVPVPEHAPAPSPAGRIHYAVGVDVLGAVGTVPSLAPGLSAFGRIGGRPWSLSLELRADAPESASRAVELGGGRVEARLYAAALVPCYHYGYVAVCLVAMAGSLQASGHDVSSAHSGGVPFAATGVRLGVEWPLSTTFALRARIDGVVNFYPATLALGQDGKDGVWSAPPLAATLGAGLVARFQ